MSSVSPSRGGGGGLGGISPTIAKLANPPPPSLNQKSPTKTNFGDPSPTKYFQHNFFPLFSEIYTKYEH